MVNLTCTPHHMGGAAHCAEHRSGSPCVCPTTWVAHVQTQAVQLHGKYGHAAAQKQIQEAARLGCLLAKPCQNDGRPHSAAQQLSTSKCSSDSPVLASTCLCLHQQNSPVPCERHMPCSDCPLLACTAANTVHQLPQEHLLNTAVANSSAVQWRQHHRELKAWPVNSISRHDCRVALHSRALRYHVFELLYIRVYV